MLSWKRRTNAPREIEEAERELQQLAEQQPGLRQPVIWLSQLLPDLVPLNEVALPQMPREIAHSKLIAGVPLLCNSPFALAPKPFRRRLRRAASSLGITSGVLDSSVLSRVISEGRWQSIHDEIAAAGVEPSAGATLVRVAAFAELAGVNRNWEHFQQAEWLRGYCPTCGAPPLLAELRGIEQLRYLRCGWCAADWQAPRHFCPFCGNRSHTSLGFIHRDGDDERLRTATCDACRRHLKTVHTLSRLTPLKLWIADFSTLSVDLMAAERGYA